MACWTKIFKEGKPRFSQDGLVTYESIKGKMRYYCSSCHSPIFVQLQSKQEQIRILLGVLNFEPKVNVTAHIWVKEKPAWFNIADNLPQFPEF